MIFLVLAGAMLILGQTLLLPYLKGPGFILYWLACFILTGMAILTALLDMRATRRRASDEHRELVDRTWRDIGREPEDCDQIK